MIANEGQPTLEEDDQDSLFGSPPPEGRAASPALALPSATSPYNSSLSASNTPVIAAAGIQNVGTIALPGSQPNSEFPIHPLALSLNHGLVPRPPALPQKQSQSIAASTSTIRNDTTVLPSTAGPSRSSSFTPPISRGTSSLGKAKKKSPPPVHFLRSQENLLGKAGRVAGITTAQPQPRGSTPSNPILIDDDDSPMIGRRNGSKSRDTSQKPMDPMKFAQPTNEEIVSVLVGQKDIFPVLESILKLIANGIHQPPPRPTGFERRTPGSVARESGPPAKKRKLNRVPAGAIDWDVPFPFAEGEGPTAYHQNWERERGKRLIAELIKLIKIAARKAAAKKHVAQRRRESEKTSGEKGADASKNVKGYYRPETALYGRQGGQPESRITPKDGNTPQLGEVVPSPLRPPIQSALHPSIPFTGPPPVTSQGEMEMQLSLDSLLSSCREPPEAAGLVSAHAVNENFQAPNTSVTPTTDKNAFDTWMNILNAFPINFDITGSETPVSFNETTNVTPSPSSVVSTPGIDDLDLLSVHSDLDAVFKSLMEIPSSIPTPSTSAGDNVISEELFSPSLFDFTSGVPNVPGPSTTNFLLNFDDFEPEPIGALGEPVNASLPMPLVTDPSLFANPRGVVSGDLTRHSSPLPSASSESQAVTPASADWDLSSPDIFSGGSGDGDGQGMWRDTLWPMLNDVTQHEFCGNLGDVPMYVNLEQGSFPEKDLDADLGLQSSVGNKGKVKVVGPSTTRKTVKAVPQFGPVTQSAFNALLSSKSRDELLACITGSASPSTGLSTSANAKLTKRSSETDAERSARIRRKEDIIRRAKERRYEIQEGLNDIKRQLWETTIEQAALVQLTRRLEVEGEISSEVRPA